jgi:CheY-like chemotaxis protein
MGTPTPIRVLILEDNSVDADLMARELRQSGIEAQVERVETETEFVARLTPEPDLILSDYQLPQFSGLQALRLVRSRGLEVPFIIVSGSIGEDIAVEAMREGADDYLLKDRTARLGPAALQALEKSRLRAEMRRAEAKLRETDVKFRLIAENVRDLF